MKIISLQLLLFISIQNLVCQNFTENIIVKNPAGYPYGVNINCDYPTGWGREFSFTDGAKNLFSFGASVISNSQLDYGYIGGGAYNYLNNKSHFMVFKPNGNIGIGTISPTAKLDIKGDIKGDKLDINGTIRSKEVKIEASEWSDFVFGEDYKLPALSEVESHIKKHKHLPDIPSEKQVIEEGVNVVEMQAKLLQKIEELTLYVIDLKKENESIKQELKELKRK